MKDQRIFNLVLNFKYQERYSNYDICNFKIKDVDDVFYAVGQIIKLSQEWEQSFKNLATLHGLNNDKFKVSKKSIFQLNEKLKSVGAIADYEYSLLKRIIDVRNYVNHSFFIYNVNGKIIDFEKINEFLSKCKLFICEATDITYNLIEKFENDNCERPIIF